MRLPLVVAAALLVPGCASTAQDTVTVFAASSLRAPFTTLGQMYEQAHPGTQVVISYAGSADLVAQLDQGAPADVLATADATTMSRTGLPDTHVFASNTMSIAVPPGNPAGVTDLRDLADPGLNVVICAPQVPCGAATATIERAAGVQIAADSEESAVADVLGKVSSGQADAGIVYTSDLVTAGELEEIAIPAELNATNTYLIAAVDAAGEGFTDLVLSAAGQRVLADDGFGPP